MSKRNKYQKKPFESSGISSDTSANIFQSMLVSAAWKTLTDRQRTLYLYMKAQYYHQKKHPENNPEMFYFNRALYQDVYGLYPSPKQFVRDRDALIEKGFIVVIEDGSYTRTKTIYKYSDKWQKFGTNLFSLDYNEMSLTLQDKKRKKKEQTAY